MLLFETGHVYFRLGKDKMRNNPAWFHLSVREGLRYNFCIILGCPCKVFLYAFGTTNRYCWVYKKLDRKNTG